MRLGQRLSSNNSIIVACGTLVVVTYVVRASLSVMSVSMAAELGWNKEAEGSVLSAFFYGYLCTNLTGGLVCRRFGAKPVVAVSVAAFCTLTFLLPAAAAVSILLLFALSFFLLSAQLLHLDHHTLHLIQQLNNAPELPWVLAEKPRQRPR